MSVTDPNAPPVEPVPTPVADPTPNPLESQLSELREQLNGVQASVAQRDDLIRQYQEALGNYRQNAPVQPEPDIDALYKPADRQFVDKRVNEAIHRTLGKLAIQADTQATVGTDAELVKATQTEVAQLKQNPYYASLGDDVLVSMAALRAKTRVLEERVSKFDAAERDKKAKLELEAARSNASLPGTSGFHWNQPTTDDPDADIKQYWEQPEHRTMWKKMLSDTGDGNVDPMSETEIRMSMNSRPEKARDIARRIAIRAIRTGVGVGPNLYGATHGGA